MTDKTGNILAFLAVFVIMFSVIGVTGYAYHSMKMKYHKEFALPKQ